jgi:hypothetical protein
MGFWVYGTPHLKNYLLVAVVLEEGRIGRRSLFQFLFFKIHSARSKIRIRNEKGKGFLPFAFTC